MDDTGISDEMVDKAMEAANAIGSLKQEAGVFGRNYCDLNMMRSALEAVAPFLRAQGLHEAAGMMVDDTGDYTDPAMARRILARADELTKPKEPQT